MNQKSDSVDESFYLSESNDGLYLAENHAKMIWQGNKDLIVKEVEMKTLVGRNLYLIGGNDCYGILKIKNEFPIDLTKFNELNERHRISETESNLWFPEKQTLFAYEFDFVKKFDYPKRVAMKEDHGLLIEDVNFLADDFSTSNFSDKAKNIVVLKNFVSFVESNNGSKKISFFVKQSNPDDFTKKLVEAKLGQITSDYSEVNFIWNKNFDEVNDACFANVYDLVLIKNDFNVVESNELYEILLMKEFVPMKCGKVFSNEKKLLDYMFGDK
jgi:hypothetical protein